MTTTAAATGTPGLDMARRGSRTGCKDDDESCCGHNSNNNGNSSNGALDSEDATVKLRSFKIHFDVSWLMLVVRAILLCSVSCPGDLLV